MRAFIRDDQLGREINEAGVNYWDVYIEEIFTLLGVTATAVSLAQLDDPAGLAGITSLVIGKQSGCHLTPQARENLAAWVRQGGILIGFAVPNLDELFGVEFTDTIRQRPDDYAIAAYCDLGTHPLVWDIHAQLFQEQKLLILSDVRQVLARDAVALAPLYDIDYRDLESPAITWHQFGAGFAGYFAFNVAKTIWLLHQGRPIPVLPGDEPHSRSSQLTVVGNNSTKVPYADEMALVVQNMLAQDGAPFVYQIPPDGEAVPDALFYWTGDEYYGPVELSLQASDFMHALGLGYHINVGVEQTPGKKDGHPMTLAQWRHIHDNGHEVSLWYDMPREGEEYVISEERLRYQSDLFTERFGYRPVCTLLDSCNWRGWADPARWMAAVGGKADNTFYSSNVNRLHPFFNGTNYGYGFGTGYPFFFYDDAEHGNARIDFIEEPMTCYELGHRGSVGHRQGFVDKEIATLEDIPLPVDTALKYHQVINMFYHPVYIVHFPRCREAIEEILRYIDFRGGRVLHLGGDAVAKWWMARAQSTISDYRTAKGTTDFQVDCAYANGIVAKVPLRGHEPTAVTCDGQPVPYQLRTEFGGQWLFIVLPAGVHQVKIAA